MGKYKLLPRRLYELLPFLYIVTGIVCAALINSTIVHISSMLLVMAGVFIFLMRRNFRKSLSRRSEQLRAIYEPDEYDGIEKRSGIDRRRRKTTQWPMMDNAGETIFSERRIAERRISVS